MSFSRKPKTIDPNEVDPSVYYYDEVYDDMKSDEKVTKSAEKEDYEGKNQGSKYMKGLLETAELRKTEKELRKFKKYARDREDAAAEGIAPEEVYLTSSYKKKLKEIKSLEEEKVRQLEREKDTTMNFLKKNSTHSKHIPKLNTCPGESESSDKEIRASAEEASGSKRETTQKTVEDKPTRKPLKSLHGRKEYLQEVLAKRTIGPVYEEAVRRYIKRKSISLN